MAKIFLAPRSGYRPSLNFQHTIDKGVPYKDVERFLDDEGKKVLKNQSVLYVWGNLPAKKSSWEKMNIGDYVFFYQRGTYTFVGNLLFKMDSRDLAQHLWQLNPKGQPWQFVFFLDNLRKIIIPAEIIQKLAGYGSPVIQGFQPLNDQGMANIIKGFGNIENFISQYITSRIALIGPTSHDYVEAINKVIQKKSQVCTSWTYVLSQEKVDLLKKQLGQSGYIHLYLQFSRKSGGSGLIEQRAWINDFQYLDKETPSPKPEYTEPTQDAGNHRGWYTISIIEPIAPRNLESFELYDTKENLSVTLFSRLRNPSSEFIYVKDTDKVQPLITEATTSSEKLTALLDEKRQIILYGPPGTGKTYKACLFTIVFLKGIKVNKGVENLVTEKEIKELKQKGSVEFVTFHPSYSYEEFVEGITANTDSEKPGSDGISYIRKWGIFKKICTRALARAIGEDLDTSKEPWRDQWNHFYDAYKKKVSDMEKTTIRDQVWKNAEKFVLIIDEINRGDVSKIFGELVTLLENDKRLAEENEITVQLPYSNDEFGVPPNLYILGTMNTADRSIALVDIALRRRFGFVEMSPDFELLASEHVEKNREELQKNNVYQQLQKSIEAIIKMNGKIIGDLGRDKQIGHSFFFKVRNQMDLIMVWQYEILPLLEEYYYCDYDKIISTLDISADNPYVNKNIGIKGFKNIEELEDFLNAILEKAGTAP